MMTSRRARELKMVVAVVAALLAGMATGWSAKSATYPVRGLRAIDGDTLLVAPTSTDMTIRLLGVDTPEKGQPLYAEAKALMATMAEGQVLTFEQPKAGQTDPYGRALGAVSTADGKVINVELVRAGLSRYYTRYGPAKLYAKELEEAEQFAKREKLGVWR